jgi:hypothetical protein
MATIKPFPVREPSPPRIEDYGDRYTEYVRAYHQYVQLLDSINAGRLAPTALGVSANFIREAAGLPAKYELNRFVPPESQVRAPAFRPKSPIEEDFAIVDGLSKSSSVSWADKIGTPGTSVRMPTPPLSKSPVFQEAPTILPTNELQRVDTILGFEIGTVISVSRDSGGQATGIKCYLPPVKQGPLPKVGHKSAIRQTQGLLSPLMLEGIFNAGGISGQYFTSWLDKVKSMDAKARTNGLTLDWALPRLKLPENTEE